MGSAAPDHDSTALPIIEFGDTHYTGKPIIYVVKASKTSYINYMKVLMLASELAIPYTVSVVRTSDPWYAPVHPERYVPTIRDRDPETGGDLHVFESTACLTYLSEEYDPDGVWRGRTRSERARVGSWVAYQTAGLGATSKYWLYFSAMHKEKLPKTVEKLYENCVKQWDILEKRLSEPGQEYIALKDRPTIADISYYPFAMSYMFTFYGLDIADWPHIKAWAEKMESRPAIRKVLDWAPTIGNESPR